MRKWALVLLCFTIPLYPIEEPPIASYPICGYEEISFFDFFYQTNRTLFIWYPVDPNTQGIPSSNRWDQFYIAKGAPLFDPQKKKPIVLLSHGYGGSPHQLSWLTRELVASQMIVIGIRHYDKIEGKHQMSHPHRPKDMETIINQFAQIPIAKGSDLEKIGIAGYSLGGTTGILLSGAKATKLDRIIPEKDEASLKDFRPLKKLLPKLDREKMGQDWTEKRIKAAFIMAPAWGWIFEPQELKKISIPTYLVAPAGDKVLAPKSNVEFFAKHIPGVIYQKIVGEANHFVFVAFPSNTKGLSKKVRLFIEDPPEVDRSWIQAQVAEQAKIFFQSNL